MRDLYEIEAYISADSRDAALLVAGRLRRAFVTLSERREVGRPSLTPGVREWSVPGLPYVLPYRIRGDAVEIIRVWHTGRQRPDAW